MNPFQRMVTVGHNAWVFIYSRTPTDQVKTVKLRLEGIMHCDKWHWRPAESDPPPGCLWQLWRSASNLTQPFRLDRNVFCCCVELAHSVWENPASDRNNSVWFLHSDVQIDNYWTLYKVEYLQCRVRKYNSVAHFTIWYIHYKTHSQKAQLQVSCLAELSQGYSQ